MSVKPPGALVELGNRFHVWVNLDSKEILNSKEEDKNSCLYSLKFWNSVHFKLTYKDMHKKFKNNPIQKGEVCVTLCVARAWWLPYEVSKVFNYEIFFPEKKLKEV